MAITLVELRTQSRQRADMENSNFVSDSELNNYINNSIAELHDILIQAYDSDYYIETSEFQTVSDQQDYDLPTDFYKLRGVDVKLNNDDFVTVRKFNFNERNRFDAFVIWDFLGAPAIRYRLLGSKIRFTPKPDKEVTVRLWYVPLATKLVNDTDSLDDFNAYSEYVIVDAAIKMMQKEESDVTVLLAEKAALKRRIEEAANNRDAARPSSISDIYNENDDLFFRVRD